MGRYTHGRWKTHGRSHQKLRPQQEARWQLTGRFAQLGLLLRPQRDGYTRHDGRTADGGDGSQLVKNGVPGFFQ